MGLSAPTFQLFDHRLFVAQFEQVSGAAELKQAYEDAKSKMEDVRRFSAQSDKGNLIRLLVRYV